MHFTLKFVIFFIYLCDQLGQKKTNLVLACNVFNDFCDEWDEAPDDIKAEKIMSKNPSVNVLKLVYHNHSNGIEIDSRIKRSPISLQREEKMKHGQVTTILDKLLFESGYDRQIRPQINGPPVQVIFSDQMSYW